MVRSDPRNDKMGISSVGGGVWFQYLLKRLHKQQDWHMNCSKAVYGGAEENVCLGSEAMQSSEDFCVHSELTSKVVVRLSSGK